MIYGRIRSSHSLLMSLFLLVIYFDYSRTIWISKVQKWVRSTDRLITIVSCSPLFTIIPIIHQYYYPVIIWYSYPPFIYFPSLYRSLSLESLAKSPSNTPTQHTNSFIWLLRCSEQLSTPPHTQRLNSSPIFSHWPYS